MNKEKYYHLNRCLVTKAIEELSFEEILPVTHVAGNDYQLGISEECSYFFQGKKGAWGNLQVSPSSLYKNQRGQEIQDISAAIFFTEIQAFCDMSDETLAIFIEEAQQTLYADQVLEERLQKLSLDEVSRYRFHQIDQILPGHPKLILNKGRLGWGANELERFSPESGSRFQLEWVAVRKEFLKIGFDSNWSNRKFLEESLDKEEIEGFQKRLLELDCNPSDYFIFPVHPWQWNRFIKIQYGEMIANQSMVPFGKKGEMYTPQVSIRTLSNYKNPKKFDIKLSTSILNTSCVRGIPVKYIETGYQISKEIQLIINNDFLLKEKNIRVLKEVGAVSCSVPGFEKVKGAPYRYNELLGCVWRESVESVLEDNEKAIPTAALLLRKREESLLAFYIKKSNISERQWIRHYFQSVIIPLYHLQLQYGVGLVAHGQNTILVLKNNIPSSLIIKDFHGDLRVSTEANVLSQKIPVLEILPPEFLIHDLITGHFITVLRYLSRILEEVLSFEEKDFYLTLGEEIENYLDKKNVSPSVDILKPHFERVLVNKVRFVKGYQETETRLTPLLGKKIKNPICKDNWSFQ